MTSLQRFINDESGATAIEYGLIAALIAVVIIGTVTALGTRIDGAFQQIRNAIPAAGGGGGGGG
jgi:pilus assembly protein Flp/PilA